MPKLITSHTPIFLQNLRHSGQIMNQILRALRAEIKPGITGLDLENLAQSLIKKAGATPAFQGFQGFPTALCISLNDEIVHGVPDDRPFQDGDIVTIDLGINFQGSITDSAFTCGVGQISPDAKRLIQATEQALQAAISIIKPGITLRQLGAKIEQTITSQNCSVVKDLCGHGVGHEVHEDPLIFNFPSHDFPDFNLQSGQIIAVEPIASLGNGQMTSLKKSWTIVTSDHTLASQTEATLLITDSGCEVISSGLL